MKRDEFSEKFQGREGSGVHFEPLSTAFLGFYVIWFFENGGGDCLELFRKLICFATVTRPLGAVHKWRHHLRGRGGTLLWTEDNFVFGQIWKFRFMYTCGIDQSFRVFYPTFDEWKSRFGAQSSQKRDLKKRKNEKMPKNSQFWACFGVFEQLNLVRLNFAVAVKLYFVHLLLIKMVGMLKSREIAWNQVFCVKNVDFSPNHKVFWGKMCPY